MPRAVANSSTAAATQAAAAAPAQRRKRPLDACLELLAETYPRCFVIHEGRRRPLKIGIFDDLFAALGGAVTARELTRALRLYTANAVYRDRLRAGVPRIDLNGEPAGRAVTAEDEAHARSLAKERTSTTRMRNENGGPPSRNQSQQKGPTP